ncbi:DNA helicase II/ATP-dependent DNA helicase PcrA [Bilophila wadsworthia 3_1_6]|uniref:DNA 3'-5' helicase n=1 Tax=Bilophila wadsworthia (strain 3_1_6) TaxID=563192 RepID=E5Y7S1_BILW3|nr:ATP-dependent helicase [Bilophila wadsworthia]EFV43937.1 DNA helicase II/ATP-dependent DNA helicase PcrA [Bilophila wadsworthia 3_1_6]
MIDISTLNPAQLEAVTAPDGPVLVIAGAGSGKTRTIVHRLAWLAEQGVPASDMLLLTFTRKASREMLLRATDLLGYSIGGVHGGTFHSFAFSVLRQYRPAWAEGPVTVMDSADSASAIQQCKERLKVGKGDRSFPKTQTIIGLLSKARNKEISIGDVLQRDAQHLLPHADALESIGEAYRGYRRQHGLLDYDDLLFELEDLLKGDPEAGREGLAERFRERYRYIMVDEYQDTNRVQARLVRLLAGEAGNVMAVGDDAQSIYAFRGADVRNILDFPKLFPGTRVIRLEENYRSTQPVLDVANAVLAPASEGFRKNLFTTKENTPKTPRVRLVRPMSDLTQANVVAARVEELLDRYQAKEIAVLFRAGYQSYHLEVALSKRGIKFRKYGGLRYAEAVHVKDVVAFVRLAINPLDMPSFERVAGLSKGVGTKTAEKIYHVAAQGDFDALRKACTKYPDLWSDMLLLDKLREHNLTPAALIEMVIEHYTPRLQAIFPDDWPRRQQGLSELAHIASAYTDLEQFVADLSLETPEDDADEFDEAGRVVLSTIHSSKGLEWDAVILLDLVEDRFPSRHALVRPEDFEEERRLMYVACTRAREDLELFVPATLYSRQNGGNEPATPSPFVRELPFSALEEWQEGYTGRISKRSTSFAGDPAFSRPSLDIPRELANPNAGRVKGVFPPPVLPEAKGDRAASKGGAGCGYCRHKVFGRGKIVEQLPPDKCRVNFPGFGLKVILSAFLTLEE